MKIRLLKQNDAYRMLEWMHDEDVTKDLAADFKNKTIEDCRQFIDYAVNQCNDYKKCCNLHLAIVNDCDEYMGTVSLKDIDRDSKNAEFAITIRKDAMGKGYGIWGMKKIIEIGLNNKDLGINDIYWCVSEVNKRAVKFYRKNDYIEIEPTSEMIDKYKEYSRETKLLWFKISRENVGVK
ncbi:diamine N-acetyltransferase [Pseudobutyrivibrio sp. JW11]|uniref:GNAT family N-acetyltransferase n=1 Tax=Pseudobutyrivibrio sp. JW11 TaxID=1855302 RepID=UPI0008EFF5D5|nr:GNAT family N-acetyltransferase [Pseudobutyrivibrio sp. JW11]SFO34781.1 diamine N-acetyltransferase [Pseudobutyrivibrio sp. JW11]